jgi:hypothetical protein
MTSWRPDRAETMRISKPHPGQGDESRLYLWIVPAEARGVWQAPGTRLTIYQNFQDIQIEGRLAGKEISESRANLIGRDITWETNRMRFRGRVQGDLIAGELERPDDRAPLMLTRTR